MSHFIVETRFGRTWENCWTVDEKPATYATRGDASRAITSHLEDVADAVAEGDMSDGYDREDYRIVRVDAC